MAHTKNLMALWVALIVLVGVVLVVPLFTSNFLGGKTLVGQAGAQTLISDIGDPCGLSEPDGSTYECLPGLICNSVSNTCQRLRYGSGIFTPLLVEGAVNLPPFDISCDSGTLSEDKKLYCYSDAWVTCGGLEAKKGTVTPNSDYWCDGNIWSNSFPMGGDDFYEVEISKQGGEKSIPLTRYEDLGFCADDIPLEFQASLCYGNTKTAPIYSVYQMNKENLNPVVEELGGNGPNADLNGVLFLYEDESIEGKNVSLVLNWDVATITGTSLNLGNFVSNLQQGQRLSLNLDGETYVIWKDQAISQFFSSLRATHLPNGEVFSLQDLPSNKYQFAVLADKAIVLGINLDGGSFKISAEKPAEALAVSPAVASLEANFEIPFTRDAPAELQDLGVTITPCADDSAAELDVMRVCLDDQEITTLNRAELTNYKSTDLGGKTISLLYLYENGKKNGYVLWNQQVNKVNSDIDHTRFVENMALGRRLALTFAEETYLLSHPVSSFSLTNLALKKYLGVNDGGQEDIISQTRSGSWKAIEFNIDEGKIYLKREEATPPPPFKISGRTTLDLTTELFDLEKNLFTTVSTTNPVNLENYGLVQVSANDVNLDASFILSRGTELSELNLKLKLPYADLTNNLLFYYTEAQEVGNVVKKTAEIYYLYDISQNKKTRPFTNNFIQTLTSGKELALKDGDAYYVLWYQGATTSGTGLFKLDELRLRSLDGTYQAPATVNNADLSVTFNTPSGDVLVEIATGPPATISFSKDQVSLSAKAFNNEMSLLLSEMPFEIDNHDYYIADPASNQQNPNSVRIFNGASFQLLTINQPQLINDLLFWYEGLVDNKKRVSAHVYQQLVDGNPTFTEGRDWAQFTKKISEGKSVVYHWADKNFILTSNNLEQITPVNLVLKTVPEGIAYNVANYKLSSEGLYNLTFAYKNNLLELRQTWDQDFANVLVNLYPLQEKLVTVEGLNFTDGGLFRSKIEGNNYQLKIQDSGLTANQVAAQPLYNLPLNLVNLERDGQAVASFYLPEKQSRSLLLPEGDIINIKLINATSHKITLTK